ncbi:hypothetical protein [Catenulispora subtropica]|uniref:hypothetical protein n=1 Tax=Catenulispora subtropica TaxID=450798 RepID=UPI0031E3F9A7
MLGSPRLKVGAAVLAAALSATLGIAPSLASASVGAGNISIGWSIPNVPSAGLTNITFPMTVDPKTLHEDGTYFAQQFGFTKSGGAYMGLQPRPNLNGHERLHAAFSSFIAGTTSTDPLCHNGADGGAGMSCGVDFDGVYGHLYALTVARTGEDTWTGTARDTVTGVSTHIGTWTLSTGSGNLTGYYGGFVEYYLGISNCAGMPFIGVTFGAPTSTDAGGLTGSSVANDEYGGDCLGHAAYSRAAVGKGAHVTRGFVADTTSEAPTTAAATTAATTADATTAATTTKPRSAATATGPGASPSGSNTSGSASAKTAGSSSASITSSSTAVTPSVTASSEIPGTPGSSIVDTSAQSPLPPSDSALAPRSDLTVQSASSGSVTLALVIGGAGIAAVVAGFPMHRRRSRRRGDHGSRSAGR